jgi:hypothetical protein
MYAQLGPAEFYQRPLGWSSANGKWKSYDRLRIYLDKVGIKLPFPPLPLEDVGRLREE